MEDKTWKKASGRGKPGIEPPIPRGMPTNNYGKCPKCGADVTTYHTSNGDGTSTHRTLCREKCDGWKPIKEWDTGFSRVTKKWYG